MRYFKSAGIFYLTLLLFSGCGMPQKTIQRTDSIMGTIWNITVVCNDEKAANSAIDEYFSEVRRLEKVLSLRDPKSELNEINRKAGTGSIKVSADIFRILQTALYVSDISGGTFDVTIGPVVKLWGFAGSKQQIPTAEEIKYAHSLVGYKMLALNEKNFTAKLAKKGMVIDLGGIAKGYALDASRPILEKYGIKNAMINAGGQVYVAGKNPGRKDWKIGIIHPRKTGDLLGVLEAADKCVSTSGNYERYFVVNGNIYHHIFDPYDSFPVKNTLSTTIILSAGDFTYPNTLADALSTAAFVAGEKKALLICSKIKNSEAIIVTAEGDRMKVRVSENLKSRVNLYEN